MEITKEVRQRIGGIYEIQVGFFLSKNYLKGAVYSSSGTDSLTLGTPVTINLIYENYNIINQHQTMLPTYTDA